MTTQGLVFASILLAGAQASAQVVVATAPPPEAPSVKRVEGRIGMLAGGSDVGDANGGSIGLAAGLGYRLGDLTLRATFDHYRVGDSNDEWMARRGRGTRVGGLVRYSFARSYDLEKERSGFGADFWGEGGLGYEHVAWNAGGVYDRPSGELAVGFDMDGHGRADAQRRRRHIGWFMAFRTFVAQGPKMDGPLVCGGPCTEATRPSRTDVSMYFEFGLHWGR